MQVFDRFSKTQPERQESEEEKERGERCLSQQTIEQIEYSRFMQCP